MSNDGLLLGAAILGGGYFAVNALSGEDGGGGGSGPGGVVNIIEGAKDAIQGAATAAQGITSTVKEVSYFFDRVAETVDDTKNTFDNGKSWIEGLIQPAHTAPTGSKAPFFETASNAGGDFGAGIGGALGSAFLGLYGGAMTVGANFVGWDSVTPQNAFGKFKVALPVAKNNFNSAVVNGVSDVLTAKAQRQFAGSVYDAINNNGGSGTGNNTYTPPPPPLPPTPTFNIGVVPVTDVRKNLENYISPPETPPESNSIGNLVDNIRKWFD